jgi:hypothetical protein
LLVDQVKKSLIHSDGINRRVRFNRYTLINKREPMTKHE